MGLLSGIKVTDEKDYQVCDIKVVLDEKDKEVVKVKCK